jgi:uncharacterized protein (TIGR02186 family)
MTPGQTSKRWRVAAALVALGLVWATQGISLRAEPIVSALSDEVIEITARFTGSQVLLFGATEHEGDIVVVVRGPWAGVVVRRKQRIAGAWINTDSVGFAGIPRYYAVASTRPLDEITGPELLVDKQIGLENLVFQAFYVDSAEGTAPFRDAVLRGEQQARLYPAQPGVIEFMGRRLFRAAIDLPPKLPIGRYDVEIHVFEAGVIVASQSQHFEVRKTGLSAQIEDFAHNQPWLYGLLAIASALVAGWLGSYLFRRV